LCSGISVIRTENRIRQDDRGIELPSVFCWRYRDQERSKIMSTMTLYYNMKRQAPENVKYPIEQQVNCIEDLRQVTAHDHVCAKYEGNYRKKNLFIQANVSMFDVDNMETDNSKDWITPEDVRDKFHDVPFYV